jgi:hypothetical protein
VVLVYLREKLVQFRIGNSKSSPFKGSFQLRLVQFAVVVSIDAMKEREQLLLGPLDEYAELCTMCLSDMRKGRQSSDETYPRTE